MAQVELRFQDAGGSSGTLLAELLLECGTASAGGGIFAWTNAAGVKSFLGDPAFGKFVKNGAFVEGGFSPAPGSGLKADGGCAGFAELVAHLICKIAFGARPFVGTGGTPASGTN